MILLTQNGPFQKSLHKFHIQYQMWKNTQKKNKKGKIYRTIPSFFHRFLATGPSYDVLLSHLGGPGGRRVAHRVRGLGMRPVRQEAQSGLAMTALRRETEGCPEGDGPNVANIAVLRWSICINLGIKLKMDPPSNSNSNKWKNACLVSKTWN